jgi:hypothetical protein
MPGTNKANRQVCDLDIRFLKNKKPFLFFNTANTTTTNMSAESVYAMAKGAKRIAFQDPMDGTLAVEAQVYPFELFALMSDGIIDTSAAFAETQKVTCVTAGQLALTLGAGEVVQTGTVFVFAANDFGGELIPGSYSGGVFTATTEGNIAVNSEYIVGYVVTKSVGVKKIAFNNKRLPNDYFITASTVDKDEDGVLTPFKQVFYKASVQRNFEIAFSSEGDPATVTVTFDLMEDKDGNYVDYIEITEDATISVSPSLIGVVKGNSTSDIHIHDASGAVTAVIKDSSDQTYAKLHAAISGDNDTLIVSADADATAGTYTVTLTDAASNTAKVTVVVSNS